MPGSYIRRQGADGAPSALSPILAPARLLRRTAVALNSSLVRLTLRREFGLAMTLPSLDEGVNKTGSGSRSALNAQLGLGRLSAIATDNPPEKENRQDALQEEHGVE